MLNDGFPSPDLKISLKASGVAQSESLCVLLAFPSPKCSVPRSWALPSLVFYCTGPCTSRVHQSHVASRPLLFSLPLPKCPSTTTGLLALSLPSRALRGLDILTSSLKRVCLHHPHHLLILLTCLCSPYTVTIKHSIPFTLSFCFLFPSTRMQTPQWHVERQRARQ